jgi:CheY-like chemotaxis protein
MIVLIADDLDINRKLLRTLLTADGYDVIDASDGSEAFQILQGATGPIVGLIDWEMPEMELLARVGIGKQMVQLQQALTERVAELREALLSVKQLGGLLPICSYCKKIRDDQNYWQQVESYVGKHSEAKFSHSICPQCYEDIIKPQMVQLGVDPNEASPGLPAGDP